jgi:hypothetical protein
LQRFVRHSPLLSTNVVAVLPSSASLRKTLQLASVIAMLALRNGVALHNEVSDKESENKCRFRLLIIEIHKHKTLLRVEESKSPLSGVIRKT